MRAKIGICIPWSGSSSRRHLFDYVYARFQELFPDVPIYLGNQPKALHFNLSAARNIACEAALADGCEILIVSDADVVIDKENLEKAVEAVASGEHHFAVPHEIFAYLKEDATVDVINGVKDPVMADVYTSGSWSCGVTVISAQCFKALNGWDERFLSWGQEDDAFTAAYQTIYEKTEYKVPGVLYTLWHKDRDLTYEKSNLARIRKYSDELTKDKMSLTLYLLRNRIDWG